MLDEARGRIYRTLHKAGSASLARCSASFEASLLCTSRSPSEASSLDPPQMDGGGRSRGDKSPAGFNAAEHHHEWDVLGCVAVCWCGATLPSPLVGALFLTRYRDEMRLRKPLVQRILFPPLAALARRRGLERTIERYVDPETHPSAEAGLGRLPEQIMQRGSR